MYGRECLPHSICRAIRSHARASNAVAVNAIVALCNRLMTERHIHCHAHPLFCVVSDPARIIQPQFAIPQAKGMNTVRTLPPSQAAARRVQRCSLGSGG